MERKRTYGESGENVNEVIFQKYFIKKEIISGLRLIKSEFQLKTPMSLFQRDIAWTMDPKLNHNKLKDVIGRIDVLFRHKGHLHAGEIKWASERKDFWDALKILGYCTYYNWQNETWGGHDIAYPAILIPKKHIKLQHQITANKLKVDLYGIIKVGDDYIIELVNP